DDWKFYQINTTEVGFDAKYPGNFGYNRDGFVFTLNMFNAFGSDVHDLVVAIDSNDLAIGVPQATSRVYRNELNVANARPTTMHGSLTGDPMWLLTEHGDGASIDVIKMTSNNGTILSNSCTFTPFNLAVSPYSNVGLTPPKNPDGSIINSSIDSRFIKAA